MAMATDETIVHQICDGQLKSRMRQTNIATEPDLLVQAIRWLKLLRLMLSKSENEDQKARLFFQLQMITD